MNGSSARSLARSSWGGGAPEALGSQGKRKRGDEDGDSEDEDGGRGYSSPHRTGAKRKTRAVEEVGDVGLIERVRLENFMCHSEFVWEPNPKVNFVTGANGSGKSSVMQGITLGLLGEPKSTKRYTKASEFIMKDASRAVIQVTLRNVGEEAYKPERYGRSITFQRTINESGASAYLLKDEEMKDVVRKSRDAKEECKRILEKFQIQVDSPIVILQQDEAKEMLKIESAVNLYKFFEKATLIKQCFDHYLAAQVEYNKAYDTLKAKARALRELNSEYRKATARYEEIQRAEAMDRELVATKGEYAWARVHAAREACEQMETDIERVRAKMVGPKDKLMGLHEKLAGLKVRKNDMDDELAEEAEKWAVQEQEVLAKRESLDALKARLKEVQASIKREAMAKNSLAQEVRLLEEQREELETGDREEADRRTQQRAATLHRLEREKKGVEEQIEMEGETREKSDGKAKEDQATEGRIQLEIRSKRERKAALSRELEEMEGAGSGQHLAVFGAKIPVVERAVQKNIQRFQRPPLGPVGQFVQLRGEAAASPELARLIETELGRPQVTAYLCSTDQDRRELNRIFEEVYGPAGRGSKPKIFTSRFLDRRHHVTRPQGVPQGTAPLADYLQIEDDNVFNHLVDQKSIESVLVCPTQTLAKQLMTHRDTVPPNVTYAITLDYYKFNPPRGTSSYRSYYMDQLAGSGMLRSTVSNLVAERGEELRGLETHLLGLEQELKQVGRSKNSYEAEKKRAMGQIQTLRGKVANFNSQLSQVKAEQESAADDLANIGARLEARRAELGVAEGRVEETVLRRAQLTTNISQNDEVYKKEKKELSNLKSSTNPMNKQEREISSGISSRTKEILNQEKLVKKLATELDGLRTDQKKQRDEERQFEAAARKITGTEIVPERSVKQLNAKIMQLQKKIKNKQENEDFAEFLAEFQDMKERYMDMKKQIERLEGLLLKIEKMNNERLDNFQIIRTIISNNVRRRFNAMIATFSKQIGCQVFLRIDNKNKELQFSFQNEDGEEKRDSTDVSRLSGGEKSFTQMCLICALWDMMEPPFRCLDEWDVFLDAVNRKAISKELLTFSLKNQSKQFIFISPQGACDLSEVDHGVVQVTEIKKS